jgi:hypothetical protein
LRKKTLTALVAVLAIGLGGCTTSKDNANTKKYPQEAKENFVDKCASSAATARPGGDDKQRRTDCNCIVDKLEEQLPYDTTGNGDSFKDADTAIRDGKDLPSGVKDDLDKATADCVQDR